MVPPDVCSSIFFLSLFLRSVRRKDMSAVLLTYLERLPLWFWQTLAIYSIQYKRRIYAPTLPF
jgi:hypothetical protein